MVPDPQSTSLPANKRKTGIHERRDIGEKAVLGQGCCALGRAGIEEEGSGKT